MHRTAAGAIVFALAISSSSAFACRIGHHYVPPETLVGYNRSIALAEVVAVEPIAFGMRYRLRLIEALRGEVPSSFTVDGQSESPVNGDFHGHHNPTTGQLYGGRMPEQTDCQVHLFFQKGGRYLVFLDALRHPHPWAAELIIADDDLWLATVRHLIGQRP